MDTNRKMKRSWMANLAVSLFVLSLVVSSSICVPSSFRQLKRLQSLAKHETNPEFPVHSSEVEPNYYGSSSASSDDLVTTMGPSSKSHDSHSESQDEEMQEETTIGTGSFSDQVQNETVTGDLSSEGGEEDHSGSGEYSETRPTLMSPLLTRQSSTTPFSSLLMNKTARHFANNNGNANLFRPSNANIPNNNSARPTMSSLNNNNDTSTTSTTIRGVKPTSSVIHNPNNYNRIVKRRKITSINGKNVNKNDEIATTPLSINDEDLPSSTDLDQDLIGPTSSSASPRINILGHQNSSRAIAGFSSKNKQVPVRVVTKTRPKPIIIRDHEGYLRNLTTETATTENSFNSDDMEEDTQPPTLFPSNNAVEQPLPNLVKVRKVKVSMSRRPGHVYGTVTSDLPLQAVNDEFSQNVTVTTASTISSSLDSVHIQEANNQSPSPAIKPSPSLPSKDDFTSTRVYKEEFGIQTDSFDHHEDDDDEDERDHNTDPSNDQEIDATTEHYYSVNIPNNNNPNTRNTEIEGRNNNNINNARFGNFKIEGSQPTGGGNEDSSARIGHVRLTSTPKYKDYFSEIGAATGNESISGEHVDSHNTDNLNHLYISNNHNNDTSTPEFAANVTKTFENDNITISNKEYQQIPPPISSSSEIHLSASSTTTPTPRLPHGSIDNNSSSTVVPHLSNSVEEHIGGSHEKNVANIDHHPQINATTSSPKISSKGVTSVYYTKVEEPHFTSSSYEFSTTKEYSYTSNSHNDQAEEHDEHEHFPPSPTPFWKNETSSTAATTSAPSSQISQVTTSTKSHDNFGDSSSEHEIAHNDISSSEEKPDTTGPLRKDSQLSIGPNGLTMVKVPALYQFPVLVKIELNLSKQIFCNHLQNFKQMIVNIYGEKREIVHADQIVLYSEPTCIEDIVPPTDSSSKEDESSTSAPALVKSTTTVTTTSSPTTVTFTTPTSNAIGKFTSSTPKPTEVSLKNATLPPTTSTTEKSENKTVLLVHRRKRRQIPQKGESLILDKKTGVVEEQHASASSSSLGSNLSQALRNSSKSENSKHASGEIVSVYFYVKDGQGNYNQTLTMAFYEFWNQTTGKDSASYDNGSQLQGVFYQRINKVDMVAASQLVAPEEGSENSGIITAIVIASIAAACLFLIGVLLLVLRHRQSQTKFAKRCTPVTLDDYSLDNISFSNSFRRKQRLRGSKRSYTNAAFDDHTAPSRVVNISTLHTALTDTPGLDAEFKAIPNVSPTLDDIPQGAESKNRYANVIPLPDTRVLLTFQEEQPNSDYINANFVRGANGEAKRYIITQGPLDETTVDFWRMIWEQQVRVIFMLTDLAELGHSKCADYYPRSETIDCSQLHGDFQITLEKREMSESCTTSYLVIKDMDRNLRRDVIHMWYHSWPEKGIPTNAKPTVDFLLKSRKFTKEPTPIVVHCSPGTGRSGTIVACDIAMKEFELQQKVDIPRLLLRLRQDRAGCVQTKEQYLHIYETLHYYATRYAASKMDPIIGTVP